MTDYANQSVQATAEFGPDPQNRRFLWLMTRQVGEAQSAYTPTYGPSELDPGRFHDGYAHDPQDFVSYNQHSGSTDAYRTGAFPDTDSALITGPMGDPTRRVFAERLARRNAI